MDEWAGTDAVEYLDGLVASELAAVGFHEQVVPDDELREREGKAGATLCARLFQQAGIGNVVRMTKITSLRANVLAIIGIPAAWHEAPLFEAEIVVFGGKVRVFYFDLPMPIEDASLQRLLRVELKQPGLEPTSLADLSPFIDGPSSVTPLFFRQDTTAKQLAMGFEAFSHYFQTWSQFSQADSSDLPNPDEQQLNQLQNFFAHHLGATPGAAYLKTIFGEEWADDYLRNFAYAMPSGSIPAE